MRQYAGAAASTRKASTSLCSTRRERMSTSGLRVTRSSPPPSPSRSTSGSPSPPGSRGPATTAGTTASGGEAQRRRPSSDRVPRRGVGGQPPAGAVGPGHPAGEHEERGRTTTKRAAELVRCSSLGQDRREQEQPGGRGQRLDGGVEPEGQAVGRQGHDPRGDHGDDDEPGGGGHRAPRCRGRCPRTPRGRRPAGRRSARSGGGGCWSPGSGAQVSTSGQQGEVGDRRQQRSDARPGAARWPRGGPRRRPGRWGRGRRRRRRAGRSRPRWPATRRSARPRPGSTSRRGSGGARRAGGRRRALGLAPAPVLEGGGHAEPRGRDGQAVRAPGRGEGLVDADPDGAPSGRGARRRRRASARTRPGTGARARPPTRSWTCPRGVVRATSVPGWSTRTSSPRSVVRHRGQVLEHGVDRPAPRRRSPSRSRRWRRGGPRRPGGWRRRAGWRWRRPPARS